MMTLKVNPEAKCPRGDRLQEEPSAKNAQGLFPPEACIFVGNLSTKVPTEMLAEDLKMVFTQFGTCHVKIKQDKKKGLPGAFVQFERVEHASAALDSEQDTVLHDRLLRIERAKGRRTACLGLRSLRSVTSEDVLAALDGRGSLEVYTIEAQQTGYQTWTDVAKVTFAFVDDCRDAIKYFQKDDKYYLHLLDMDGSPLLKAPQGPPRSKPYNGRFPPRAGSFQRTYNNRHYRNGNGNFNNRGGYRGGYQKSHQMNNENLAPRPAYPGNPPKPTFVTHGATFNTHEVHPSLINPHYAPPVASLYGGHAYAYHEPGPTPMHVPYGPYAPPDAFYSPPLDPSFLHCGQPPIQPHYLPPPGPYCPPGFIPNHGPVNPPPGMNVVNGPPNGYLGPVGPPVGPFQHTEPMGHVEPAPGPGAPTRSPPNVHKGTFPPRKTPSPVKQMVVTLAGIPEVDETVEKTVEQSSENDIVGGVSLNPESPEKAPRLIRVYHDDDDDEEEDLKNTITDNDLLVSIEEITDDSVTEADSRSRSRSRTLSQSLRRSRSQSPSRSHSHSHSGSRSRSVSATGLRFDSSPDSAPPSDSEKSKKTIVRANDTPIEDPKPSSPINSVASTSSSHTCTSPTSKPVVDYSIATTGISVEKYTRDLALEHGYSSEEDLQDIINEIVEERRMEAEKEEREALLTRSDHCLHKADTDTGGCQNGSVARNCSVKSV